MRWSDAAILQNNAEEATTTMVALLDSNRRPSVKFPDSNRRTLVWFPDSNRRTLVWFYYQLGRLSLLQNSSMQYTIYIHNTAPCRTESIPWTRLHSVHGGRIWAQADLGYQQEKYDVLSIILTWIVCQWTRNRDQWS